ncbi:MAG TPA: hypothetical protein GX724_06885 [Fibrobacter sp.]|nr:hypothetical protein [Fibrobacter sp.]
MNDAEIISIAILWCIGLLALIQALNARGAIRISLTWIVTSIILLISIAVTYIQFTDNEVMAISSSSIFSDSTSNNSVTYAKQNEVRMSSYFTSSKKLTVQIKELINSVEEFNIEKKPTSESERETWERQALSLSKQTAKINQRTLGLFHPREVSELHGTLVKATENLRLAGYTLHAFSTLEDPEQKQVQKEQYLHQITQAKKNLDLFKLALEKIEQL